MSEFPPSTDETPVPRASTADRLFELAVRHFRTGGYDSTPVSRLTAEAGVAKGTFFLHFPTKDHILSKFFEEQLERVTSALREEGKIGPEAIVVGLDRLAEGLLEDRSLAKALIPRLPILPPLESDLPAPAARLDRWIEDRLQEALPVSLPAADLDDRGIAVLLATAVEGTLGRGLRAETAAETIRSELGSRLLFILRSAGLPA